MKITLKAVLFIFVISSASCSQDQESTSEVQKDSGQKASLATDQPDVAQSLLDKGSKLWSEKKLDLAEAEFRKAIEKYPKSAKAHARLAGFLLTQSKTTDAIPAYQDAIILDPENPKLFAALSIAYLHQQKFNMAKAMADEAMRLNPEMSQVKQLNEYITTKQEIIAQTSKVKIAPGSVKPTDAMHGGAVVAATHGNTTTSHGNAVKNPNTSVKVMEPAPVAPTAPAGH